MSFSSALSRSPAIRGAKVTLSRIDIGSPTGSGRTIATRRRTSLASSLRTSTPSSSTVPSYPEPGESSSVRLRQVRKVDFALPAGPMMPKMPSRDVDRQIPEDGPRAVADGEVSD